MLDIEHRWVYLDAAVHMTLRRVHAIDAKAPVLCDRVLLASCRTSQVAS